MAENPRIEELRRRVQLDPASIAFAALAEEYRRAGRFEEAIATCTSGLVRHPSYLSAHVTLGRSLLEVGRYDEAQQELEHVLRLAPENLAAIRGLAEIHHRRGEATAAADGASAHTGSTDATPQTDATPHPVDDFNAAVARSAPPLTTVLAPTDEAFGPAPATPAARSASVATPATPMSVSTAPAATGSELARPQVESAVVARLESFLSAIRRARAAQAISR